MTIRPSQEGAKWEHTSEPSRAPAQTLPSRWRHLLRQEDSCPLGPPGSPQPTSGQGNGNIPPQLYRDLMPRWGRVAGQARHPLTLSTQPPRLRRRMEAPDTSPGGFLKPTALLWPQARRARWAIGCCTSLPRRVRAPFSRRDPCPEPSLVLSLRSAGTGAQRRG